MLSVQSPLFERLNKPLETRPYRYKKAAFHFFCPLCRTQRAMTTNHRLSAKNFAQVALITIAISSALYPWMEFRGIFSFFIVWPMFEGSRRVLFRKEVPCPHCGFDAGWYKKDVKMARKKVAEFWDARHQLNNDNTSSESDQSKS